MKFHGQTPIRQRGPHPRGIGHSDRSEAGGDARHFGWAERAPPDVLALYLKTKNFHWHMSGHHFRDYHLLLEEQGDQIFAMTDPIAERARKIGGTTLRSIGHIARHTAHRRTTMRSMSSPRICWPSCATTISNSRPSCARYTMSAKSMRTSRQRACWRCWIDETERRTWFLFEATRSVGAND